MLFQPSLYHHVINVNHYLKIPIFKHIDSVRKNSRIEQSFANLSLRKITISIQGFSSDHPSQETPTVRHFSRSPSWRNYAPFPLISALLSRTFTNRAFPSVYNAPLRGPYKSMHTRGCSFLFANGVVPPQCPPYSISWTRPSTSPLLSLPKPPPSLPASRISSTKQLVKRARGKLNKPCFEKINAAALSKANAIRRMCVDKNEMIVANCSSNFSRETNTRDRNFRKMLINKYPFLSSFIVSFSLSRIEPSILPSKSGTGNFSRHRAYHPASIFLTNRSEKIGKLDGTRNSPRLVCLPRGEQVSRASIPC